MLEVVPENPDLENAIKLALESLRPNIVIKKINLSATEDGRWIIDLPSRDSLKLYNADLEQIWLMIADRIAEKHGANGLDNVFLKEPYKEPVQIKEYWAKKRTQIEDKEKTNAILALLNDSTQNKLALPEAALNEFWADPMPRTVLYRTHCVGAEFGGKESDRIDIYVIYSHPNSKLKQGLMGFKTEKEAWAAIEVLRDHYRSLADKVSSEQALQAAPKEAKDKFTEQCPELARLPDQIALNIYRLMKQQKGRILIEELAQIDSDTPGNKSAKDLRDKALTPPKSFEEAACLLITHHMVHVFLTTNANEVLKQSLVRQLKQAPMDRDFGLSLSESAQLVTIDDLCRTLRARLLNVEEVPSLYSCPLERFFELAKEKLAEVSALSEEATARLGIGNGEVFDLLWFAVNKRHLGYRNCQDLVELARIEHSLCCQAGDKAREDLKRIKKALSNHRESADADPLRKLFRLVRELT